MDSAPISAQEKGFIIDGVEDGMRSDGRRLLDYRPISVESGVLPQANGSARVRIGNATDVLVGVKAELTTADDGAKERSEPNRLNFFIDFSAVASPQFAGRGGNDFAEELAGIFSSAYDNDEALPDLNKKCVLSPFHVWSIYVDAVVVKCGGNVVDAISLGVKAALANCEICEVVVLPADADKVMIDLPEEVTTWCFDVSRVPLVVAANRIGNREVFDADEMEEASSTVSLLVGILPPATTEHTQEDEGMDLETTSGDASRITCLKELGGGSLDPLSVQSMLDAALRVGTKMDQVLMQWINKETGGASQDDTSPFEASRTFLR